MCPTVALRQPTTNDHLTGDILPLNNNKWLNTTDKRNLKPNIFPSRYSKQTTISLQHNTHHNKVLCGLSSKITGKNKQNEDYLPEQPTITNYLMSTTIVTLKHKDDNTHIVTPNLTIRI